MNIDFDLIEYLKEKVLEIYKDSKEIKDIEVNKKEGNDIVTAIDLYMEKKIIETIKEYFPEHSIYSEECGEEKNKSEYEWFIDPIDEPCANFDEVTNLWNVVGDNQKDISYKFEIVSFNEETCIINWQMTRTMTKTDTKQEIDGIFQISVNDDGKCTYFKQWRFTR